MLTQDLQTKRLTRYLYWQALKTSHVLWGWICTTTEVIWKSTWFYKIIWSYLSAQTQDRLEWLFNSLILQRQKMRGVYSKNHNENYWLNALFYSIPDLLQNRVWPPWASTLSEQHVCILLISVEICSWGIASHSSLKILTSSSWVCGPLR